MKTAVTKALLAVLLIMPPAASAQADHEHAAVEGARIAIADGARNQIRIVDASTGGEVGSFTVPGGTGGELAVSSSGTYLIATHPDANRVSIIHSGLLYEDHGDHGHLIQSAPYVVATMNVGKSPDNVTVGGDEILVWNAGDGSVAILNESMFGLSLNHDFVDVAQPGSGTAIRLGDYVLAGLSDLDRVDVHGPDGSLVETIGGCPDLGGAIAVEDIALFGCGDRVLKVERNGDRISGSHLEIPGGGRIDSFYGHAGAIAVASFGAGLAFVNSVTGEVTTMNLPSAPLAAEVWGDRIAVLTGDGSLQLLRVAEEASGIIYTLPDLMNPDATSGRPDLTVHEANIYVSEPAAGNLIRLEIAGDEVHITDVFAVGGIPGDIQVLMPSGEFGHDH